MDDLKHLEKYPNALALSDDDFAAEYAGLTTFRQSANEIAEISAQMMLDQIDGKTVPPIIRCRPELIERNSVKTIRGFRLF